MDTYKYSHIVGSHHTSHTDKQITINEYKENTTSILESLVIHVCSIDYRYGYVLFIMFIMPQFWHSSWMAMYLIYADADMTFGIWV